MFSLLTPRGEPSIHCIPVQTRSLLSGWLVGFRASQSDEPEGECTRELLSLGGCSALDDGSADEELSNSMEASSSRAVH